ncbi:8642_t:CDS:2, partial [Cetraspora pellucida]
MRGIANYCIIDALRCQELMVKRNVVNDYQEVSSIAYVSLSDAHYFAEGMKVCNLLGAEAWSSNMLCSMIASENTEFGKYLGAYVITPIKGLKNKCPVIGLNFVSLYPSLIMTYNFSPDKIILSCKEAINVIRNGKKIHIIKFLFNGQTIEAWSIHHNNIPEEKGLYARAGNNLSPFYQLQLAGGVTSARQRNIKFVKKFVEDKGFGVKYEDTDSLYLICSKECFQKLMANLCNEVNTELEKNNRTPYLNMAYEKENVEKLSKLDYDEFIQTCIWRPKKEGKWRNISVEWFVLQIGAKYSCKVLENQQLIKKSFFVNECLYKVPKPGERFSYIVVVSEEIYNNCEKKISQQKGDCMEYSDV